MLSQNILINILCLLSHKKVRELSLSLLLINTNLFCSEYARVNYGYPIHRFMNNPEATLTPLAILTQIHYVYSSKKTKKYLSIGSDTTLTSLFVKLYYFEPDIYSTMEICRIHPYEIIKVYLEDPRVDPNINYSLQCLIKRNTPKDLKLLLTHKDHKGIEPFNLVYAKNEETFRLLLKYINKDALNLDNLMSFWSKTHEEVKTVESIADFLSTLPEEDVRLYLSKSMIYLCKNHKKHIEYINLLLDKYNANPGSFQSDLLVLACRHGITSLVKRLLYDSRVNIACQFNQPIMEACEKRKHDLVRLMLTFKRITEFPYPDGSKTIDRLFSKACEVGNIQTVKLLFEDNGCRATPNDLCISVRNNKKDIISYFIDKGVDMSAENNSALLAALDPPNYEIARLLVNLDSVLSIPFTDEIVTWFKRYGWLNLFKLRIGKDGRAVKIKLTTIDYSNLLRKK